MNSVIIVAAGDGKRVGEMVPKQFININGKQILSYSVDVFINHPKINEVIIVIPSKYFDEVSKYYPKCKIVIGGKTRQESSLNGVLNLNNKTENVLIHDAARPFISENIISSCLNKLNFYTATAPILNSTNSLIEFNNNKFSYIDRALIYEVQTPQCFKREIILNILSSNLDGTDEMGMLLRKSPDANISFIDGDIKNKKITTKLDLELFKIKNY